MCDIKKEVRNLLSPDTVYSGSWEYGEELNTISLKDEYGQDLYQKFLDRYYYKPLECIISDEKIVKSFHMGIVSLAKDSKRNLYFSKQTFFKNIIANLDELELEDSYASYQNIKKFLREKKDKYRDCTKLGEISKYYNEIKEEYNSCHLDIPFEEFVKTCQKKYTKILSGFKALLAFFDKPLNIEKFISCFDINQFYLLSSYIILKKCQKKYETTNKKSVDASFLEKYKETIQSLRTEEPFYNTFITLKEEKQIRIYTPDDLIKEYSKLLENVNR